MLKLPSSGMADVAPTAMAVAAEAMTVATGSNKALSPSPGGSPPPPPSQTPTPEQLLLLLLPAGTSLQEPRRRPPLLPLQLSHCRLRAAAGLLQLPPGPPPGVRAAALLLPLLPAWPALARELPASTEVLLLSSC